MTDHRFRVGNLVRSIPAHDLEAGKVGRVADPPENIKGHQVAHGLGSYRDHVRRLAPAAETQVVRGTEAGRRTTGAGVASFVTGGG